MAVFFISLFKSTWKGCWRMSYRKTTGILWGTDGFFPVTLSSPDLRWMHPNTPDFLVSFLVSQLLINQMLVLIGNIFSLIWKMIERGLTWASPSVLPKKPVWQKSYFQISIISSSQICSFRKKKTQTKILKSSIFVILHRINKNAIKLQLEEHSELRIACQF